MIQINNINNIEIITDGDSLELFIEHNGTGLLPSLAIVNGVDVSTTFDGSELGVYKFTYTHNSNNPNFSNGGLTALIELYRPGTDLVYAYDIVETNNISTGLLPIITIDDVKNNPMLRDLVLSVSDDDIDFFISQSIAILESLLFCKDYKITPHIYKEEYHFTMLSGYNSINIDNCYISNIKKVFIKMNDKCDVYPVRECDYNLTGRTLKINCCLIGGDFCSISDLCQVNDIDVIVIYEAGMKVIPPLIKEALFALMKPMLNEFADHNCDEKPHGSLIAERYKTLNTEYEYKKDKDGDEYAYSERGYKYHNNIVETVIKKYKCCPTNVNMGVLLL